MSSMSGLWAQGDRLREVVGQLQEAVHPGAAATLPEAFRRAVAAEQAASRFPLDAQSPLQLRDVRPPALRSLPDPDAPLSSTHWPVPPPADGLAALHAGGHSAGAADSDDSASSTSRAGVYIWHDAQAKRKQRPPNSSSESGSSTQPAAWLRGIQQKAQHSPASDTERLAPLEAPREHLDDNSLPLSSKRTVERNDA